MSGGTGRGGAAFVIKILDSANAGVHLSLFVEDDDMGVQVVRALRCTITTALSVSSHTPTSSLILLLLH